VSPQEQADLLPPPISSTSASRANELAGTSSVGLKRRACDQSAVQHRRRCLHHRPSLAGILAAHCEGLYCRCQAHSSRLDANVKPDADVLRGHHSSSSNLEVSRGPTFGGSRTSQNASCRRCKRLRQRWSGGYCIRFTYRPDGRRRTARTARTAGRQGVKPEIHGRPPDTEPVWSGPTGVSHDTRARRRRNRGVFCAVLRSQFAFGIFL
jgi:hypothetical protein